MLKTCVVDTLKHKLSIFLFLTLLTELETYGSYELESHGTSGTSNNLLCRYLKTNFVRINTLASDRKFERISWMRSKCNDRHLLRVVR
jgi:hypothetical protein